VFFLKGSYRGLIDFYFACNDFLAYDLAVCLNAWCFESDNTFNVTRGRALIQGYEKGRRLSGEERDCLPILARGARTALPPDAALRLADGAERRARHAEGPARVSAKAAVPPEGRQRRRLWRAGMTRGASA
jgi:Ser/Thr protein kinase RdoA (MazF antagonist)